MNLLSKYSRNLSSKKDMPEGILELERLGKENKEKYLDLTKILATEEILTAAYYKIKKNKGSETLGSDSITLDAINKKWFEQTIKDIRTGSYKFKPARIVEIPKSNGGFRKLGIPSPRDKIIQEGMRMILEAIYEKSFSELSYGFRSGRSVHNALNEIRIKFGSITWFIEGDISKCFDSFDHKIIIHKLEEKIQDQVFIDLIYKSLKAGYLEQGLYKTSEIGTPQGSVLSPILANIYLDELDKYMEIYKKDFDIGIRKRSNPQYNKILRNKNITPGSRSKLIRKLKVNPLIGNDIKYKRLHYVRYADDFLIGIIGSKEDCIKIKEDIRNFLKEKLNLTLNIEKTKITHASKSRALYLGYEIHITPREKKPITRIKTIKAGKNKNIIKTIINTPRPLFSIPISIIIDKFIVLGYCKSDGEPTRVGKLTPCTDKYIIEHYSAIWRGIANYYCKATNFWQLNRVYYILIYSCLLTLVSKNRLGTKKKGVKKYGMPMKIQETIIKKGKKIINIIQFPPFEKPYLRFTLNYYDPIKIVEEISKRSQRTIESLNMPCSICGSTVDVEMHHINPIKNIKSKDYLSLQRIKLIRRQIPVCQACHNKIHKGQYNGPKL